MNAKTEKEMMALKRKWMNEWMNEWMEKQGKERCGELENEWMNEWKNREKKDDAVN